jgi:endoglucanase
VLQVRKLACLGVLLITGCVLGIPSPAAASPPDLEVQGNQIRDLATGREFIPRGVNWPSFEYACVQGWGYSNMGATPETAQAMLDWHINTVRIPLNQDCWLGDDGQPSGPGQSAAEYQNAVEAFVDDLTSAGIGVILDLHWTASDGSVADGLRPMADQRSDNFWVSAAIRFRSNPSVIFDLFNEPHSRWNPLTHSWTFEQSWTCWRHGNCLAPNQPDTDPLGLGDKYTTVGMGPMLAAVRSTGAMQPVILSGLDYANDLSEWSTKAPLDDQLIAGFHNYPGQRCSNPGCWSSEIAAVANDHPVITTEVGQNNCQTGFVDNFMDWADQRNIGYLAWAWWVLPELGCSNYALIEDLAGTPTPTYGVAYRHHLLTLAGRPDKPHPPPEEPEIRTKAGLKIVWARFHSGKLNVRLRIKRVAVKAVSARIEFIRGGKLRKIGQKVKMVRGVGNLKQRLPSRSRPKRLYVRYPGDELLLPQKASRSLRQERMGSE